MNFINRSEAAEFLREQLGETKKYWYTFLQNNSNPIRTVRFRIPFNKSVLGKGVLYDAAQLEGYAKLANGEVSLNPSDKFAELKASAPSVPIVSAELSEEMTITFVLDDPIVKVRFTLTDAKKFYERLGKLISAFDK